MMSLLKKRFLKTIAILVLGVVCLSATAGLLLNKFVTKDLLEQKIEESDFCLLIGLNSRYESPALNQKLRKKYQSVIH